MRSLRQNVFAVFRFKVMYMNQFKVGKEYSARSVCDYDCIFSGTVLKTTEKTVRIDMGIHGIKTCKIHQDGDRQFIFPLGRYSMAPIFRA